MLQIQAGWQATSNTTSAASHYHDSTMPVTQRRVSQSCHQLTGSQCTSRFEASTQRRPKGTCALEITPRSYPQKPCDAFNSTSPASCVTYTIRPPTNSSQSSVKSCRPGRSCLAPQPMQSILAEALAHEQRATESEDARLENSDEVV